MIKSVFVTSISLEKIYIEGLTDHILSTYDMSDPPNDNYNIFDTDSNAVISELKDVVYDRFKNYCNKCYGVDLDWYEKKMNAWITGYGDLYSMTIHNHSGTWFSAVYYALAEEQDQGGDIVFYDPRMNANRGYDERFDHHFESYRIQPTTGDLVIFPSFLYHHVNPYFSRFRIAIPIDLMLFNYCYLNNIRL